MLNDNQPPTRPPVKIRTLSAGVVVIRRMGDDWRFLLLRSFRNWDFPKGRVEAGEQPLEAALREVREETSLTELDFCWGHDYRETVPYAHGKVARYYIAVASAGKVYLPVSPELGRPEHNEFRWVDCVRAQALLPPRLQPILDWAWQTLSQGTKLP